MKFPSHALLRPGFSVMLLLSITTFLIGWRIAKSPGEAHDPGKAMTTASASLWTCSMHPQIRQPGPGACPICKMDLIRATAQQAGGLREISVMPETAALMDFRVTPVVRAAAVRRIHLFGTVAYDERRVQNLTAWVGGRLDRMFVDFTGTTVRTGDHLAEIYSPDLFVAQQDLIAARRQVDAGGSATQRMLYQAAREKLRLLGIPDDQIDTMAAASQPADRVTLNAPQDGIVVEKIAREGDYVSTGQKLYTIADLSMVWVNLEAYETDLPWLRFAQDVTFTSDAVPGREFHGRIAFIDPVLDRLRRVVSVRVNVENDDRLLRPGTFVSGHIQSQIDGDGHVLTHDLTGKWISPMHPEIIKDGPGTCDICGMDLEPAEKLGFLSPGKAGHLPLLVPASAVLRTGERAIVYLQHKAAGSPTFEGREIILGARAGDHYLVETGLSEGDLVLTRGAFKLDSELQLQARPSMMSPNAGLPTSRSPLTPDPALSAQWAPVQRALSRLDPAAPAQIPALVSLILSFDLSLVDVETEALWNELSRRLVNDLTLLQSRTSDAARTADWDTVRQRLGTLNRHLGLAQPDATATLDTPPDPKAIAALRSALAAYFPLHAALSQDDDATAKTAATALATLLQKQDSPLAKLAVAVASAPGITDRRVAFEPLTAALAELARAQGHDQLGGVYLMHCPMAFDNRGADWLQSQSTVENPYFGASMFKCGELRQVLSPVGVKADQ